VQQMRRAVLRDMEWLLNTPRRFTPELAAEFPLAASSVLNYGIADLCGLTASSVDPREIERMIASCIQLFEPRVMRGTIGVTATASAEAFGANAVAFEIRGEMWAQPLPEPLFVKTDVDLETGRCNLKESVGGSHG
jgi:type VI secretion system protein ImpF